MKIKITKSLFPIIIILVPSLYFGFVGKPTEMGLSIVAGCFVCVFANINKFTKFKGAGFEAELREAVQEAHITIKEIRSLMKPLILFSYHQLVHSGRLGSGRERLDKLADNLMATVQALSIQNDADIKSASEEYRRYKGWDLYNSFIQSIVWGNSNPEFKPTRECKEIYDNLHTKLQYDCTEFPTKEYIEEIFKFHKTEIPKHSKEKFNTYLKYIENNYSSRK